MTDPEQALERARAAAAEMRASGAYAEDTDAHALGADPSITTERLAKWALIEPDIGEVRSTRRIGAPVTALKRGLLRLLAQYHAELLSQQTRFNVYVVNELRRLEQRIERLERERERPADPPQA